MAALIELKIYRTTNVDGTPINPKPKFWQRGPLKPSREPKVLLYHYRGDVRSRYDVALDTGILVTPNDLLTGFSFTPEIQELPDGYGT